MTNDTYTIILDNQVFTYSINEIQAIDCIITVNL